MKRSHSRVALTAVVAVAVGPVFADPPATRLVVVRLGDGGAPVSDVAQPVFLDEYDPSSGALIASHAVPATGPAALTIGGAGAHDGHLNVSSDGRYLLFGGYRANAGASNPVLEQPSAVKRVIGRVDRHWNFDTSTALADAYDRCDITAVASDNGERFWTAGEGKYLDLVNGQAAYDFRVPTTTGGLRYIAALGAATSVNVSQTQTNPSDLAAGPWPDSIRNLRINSGQVYINTPAPESFGYRGAYIPATPLPTSGVQTMTGVITNAPPSTDASGKFVPKSDSIFLDLDSAVPGYDTAYSTGGKADYQKWSLVGGAWVRTSNVNLPNTSEEINAFTASVSGTTVTLYAASDQHVFKLVDSSGYNAAISQMFSTPLILPPANTVFRGLALITDPCAGTLRGDANCDGVINNFDIDYFVAGLLNNGEAVAPQAYTLIGGSQECWEHRACWGNVNQDGAFNNFDIDSFVACILNLPASGSACP